MPFGREGAQDGGVVDQVAEDGQRAGVGVFERERDGVANAETHAEMGGAEDTHDFTVQSITAFTLHCKEQAVHNCTAVVDGTCDDGWSRPEPDDGQRWAARRLAAVARCAAAWVATTGAQRTVA